MKAVSRGGIAIIGSSGIPRVGASGPAVRSLAGEPQSSRGPCGMGSPLALLASFTKFRRRGQAHTTLKYSLAT